MLSSDGTSLGELIRSRTLTWRTGWPMLMGGAIGTDQIGVSVSPAGDVNGDGVDDIIIGSPYADPPALVAYSNGGIAYVFFGRDVAQTGIPFVNFNLGNMNPTVGFRILGAAQNDNLGVSVAGVGDTNSDGVDDIAVGANVVNWLIHTTPASPTLCTDAVSNLHPTRILRHCHCLICRLWGSGSSVVLAAIKAATLSAVPVTLTEMVLMTY